MSRRHALALVALISCRVAGEEVPAEEEVPTEGDNGSTSGGGPSILGTGTDRDAGIEDGAPRTECTRRWELRLADGLSLNSGIPFSDVTMATKGGALDIAVTKWDPRLSDFPFARAQLEGIVGTATNITGDFEISVRVTKLTQGLLSLWIRASGDRGADTSFTVDGT